MISEKQFSDKPEFDGEWVRLKGRIEYVRGVAYKPESDLRQNLNDDSYVLLRANNIKNGEIDLGDVQYVSRAKVKPSQLLRKGDILVCASSGSRSLVGKAALIKEDMSATFGTFCCVIRSLEGESSYLGHYFQSDAYRRKIEQACSGSNINNLKADCFFDLRVPVRKVETRGLIVRQLDALRTQIKMSQKQLSALDDLVKSQFVEMFGGDRNPVIRASEVLTNFRNGVSPSKMGKVHSDVLTLSSITRGRFDAAARKDGTFEEMPQADKRVSSRDFYICRGNGNKKLVGVAAFAEEDHPDLVFPDTMIAVTVNDSTVCQSYLAYEWAQPNVRRQIESKARTTNGTFKINQKTIAGVQIPLPPLEEQIKFADFVARVDKLGFDVQQQIEKLETLKQSLMQEYFG